jgi:hypothetical protein
MTRTRARKSRTFVEIAPIQFTRNSRRVLGRLRSTRVQARPGGTSMELPDIRRTTVAASRSRLRTTSGEPTCRSRLRVYLTSGKRADRARSIESIRPFASTFATSDGKHRALSGDRVNNPHGSLTSLMRGCHDRSTRLLSFWQIGPAATGLCHNYRPNKDASSPTPCSVALHLRVL